MITKWGWGCVQGDGQAFPVGSEGPVVMRLLGMGIFSLTPMRMQLCPSPRANLHLASSQGRDPHPWNTLGSAGCGGAQEPAQEQEGQCLDCLFPVEGCQGQKRLRQQIIKAPLFIATSVEIFVCVCVCVRAGIQFGNGYSAQVGGLSLSLSWSLLLLTGTQKRDERRADGLGVLRSTSAKGWLIVAG